MGANRSKLEREECSPAGGGTIGASAEREAPVSFTSFSIFFVLVAAAIAVWIDARFPRLSPGDLRAAAIRLAVAFVAAHATVPLASYLVRPMPPAGEMTTVLAVGFVAMTFLMLAVVWIVRTLQQLAGGMLR